SASPNWRSGSQNHVGKTAIFSLEGEYTYASFILRIRLNEIADKQFYYYLINFYKEIGAFLKDTSMQVNFKLNATTFRDVKFPVPLLQEQQKIAAILSSVDEQIESYEQEKEKYLQLKKGLMQQLLTGKMRVTV
ncbi:restriction endonuclease subunit S, partial [Bacillus cereus]|nr:restriction endonuclease subunit S [Bacillus cereus]